MLMTTHDNYHAIMPVLEMMVRSIVSSTSDVDAMFSVLHSLDSVLHEEEKVIQRLNICAIISACLHKPVNLSFHAESVSEKEAAILMTQCIEVNDYITSLLELMLERGSSKAKESMYYVAYKLMCRVGDISKIRSETQIKNQE